MTKKGFNQELHKQILIKILVDIFKEFGGKLGFKGGTCAYLFYELPRISFDLDFDLLSTFGKEDVDTLRTILAKKAMIRDFRDKRFTIFFLLDYKKDAPNIKVEFNKRIWKNNAYKTIWFLGVEMKIADESTILTNKLVALSDRRMPVARDLFDGYYLLKLGFKLNEKLIIERLGKTLEEYIEFLVPFIERTYNEKNILGGLGEILEEKQKEWVKKELIQEMVKELRKLEPLKRKS
jgi:predicted nucleotidyltransferase component of viral defense system